MKNSLYILILILFFSCKKEKEYEFTEEDAYKLVNQYFIKDLSKRDTFLLFNDRQLKPPNKNYLSKFEDENYIKQFDIEDGEIPMPEMVSPPYPIFTKKHWNTTELKKVRIINSKEWFSYFNEDSIKSNKIIWKNKYGFNQAHNVSYPIYLPKSKIAIIKDYLYKPFWNGCIRDKGMYFYKKVDTIWVRL